MTYKIQKLMEKGKFNWKGLKNILHNHETRLDALEGSDGDESTAGTILYRIKSVEDAIGKASGTGAGGILKDVSDINTAIGDATDPAQGTILYRLAQLEAESTTSNDSTPTEQEPSGQMKYSIQELFKGKFPNPKNLYDQLKDLERQIDNGADAVPVVRENVKLTKTALKKSFGKDFKNIGIVHNEEGSYLIIAKEDKFKFIALEDI